MASKSGKSPARSNDEIRSILLQYFYNRNKNATSKLGQKGVAGKISDIRQQLTTAFFLRQKDGPYCTDLHIKRLQKTLPRLAVSQNRKGLMLSQQEGALFPGHNDDQLDDEETIISALAKYSRYSDGQLKTAAYLTAPMKDILRKEKYHHQNMFNAPIDFSLAKSNR
jgi:hypothetical protein